jgi:hypothetical protein
MAQEKPAAPPAVDDVQWDPNNDIVWDEPAITPNNLPVTPAPPQVPRELIRANNNARALFQEPVPLAGQRSANPTEGGNAAGRLFSGAMDMGLEVGGAMAAASPVGRAMAGTSFVPKVLAMAASSGVGGAAGRAVSTTLVHDTPPPSVDQFARDMLDAYNDNALGEVAAHSASAAWTAGKNLLRKTKLGAPRAGRLSDAGREAAEYLDGHVTPAQTTDSSILQTMENLFQGSMFSGRYRQFIAEQAELLRGKADEILAGFGPHHAPEEAGKVIQGAVGREIGKVDDFGRAQFNVAGQSAEQARDLRTSLRNDLGNVLTEEDAGIAWQALQKEAHESAKKAASALYKEVDAIAGDTPMVDISGPWEFATEEAKRRGEIGMALAPGQVKASVGTTLRAGAQDEAVDEAHAILQQSLAGARTADQSVKGARSFDALRESFVEAGIPIDAIAQKKLTFEQAHQARSALGRMIRNAEKSTDANAKNSLGPLKQLYASFDNAMTEAADTVPGLRPAYDRASAAWKDMAETFERGLLDDVAGKEPRLVVSTLIKDGRVQDLHRVRKKMGDAAWRNVQSAHVEQILRNPDGSWADAAQLRKRLSDLTPETIDAVYGKKNAGRLSQYLRYTQSAEHLGTAGKDTIAQAERLRREIPEAYKLLQDVVKPGKVEDIEKLRAIVGDQDWKVFQYAYADKLLKHGDNIVSGAKLTEDLAKLTPETVRAIFPDGAANGIYQLARVMKQVQGKSHGALKMWIQLAQGSAVGTAAFGALPPSAAAVLIAPSVLAKIVLSPTARQWLTTGLKESSYDGARPGTRAVALLGNWLVQHGLIPSPRAGAGGGPGTADPFQVEQQTGRGGGPGPRGAGGPPPVTPPAPAAPPRVP